MSNYKVKKAFAEGFAAGQERWNASDVEEMYDASEAKVAQAMEPTACYTCESSNLLPCEGCPGMLSTRWRYKEPPAPEQKERPVIGETDVANYEKYTGIIRSNVGALNELNGRMTEQDTRVDKLEAEVVSAQDRIDAVKATTAKLIVKAEARDKCIESLDCRLTDRLLQANKLTMRLMDVEADNVNNIAVIAKLIDEAKARDKRIDDLTERVKGKAGHTEATEDRPCENCKDCDMPPGQEPCKECLAHPSRYALDKTWTHPNWRPKQ